MYSTAVSVHGEGGIQGHQSSQGSCFAMIHDELIPAIACCCGCRRPIRALAVGQHEGCKEGARYLNAGLPGEHREAQLKFETAA